MPGFAFADMDGGAGADGGIARNWRALDAVEPIPRYGRANQLPPLDTELLGRRYAAPIGIALMGAGRGRPLSRAGCADGADSLHAQHGRGA